MLAFTLRPLNCKSFFLVARNDWNLSNLKNSYHVAKTMNFTKTYRPFVCQGFDFILKWFQITRSRKKYKKSGQFEQKTPPFFVSSGERKNHCHLVCRTVVKTREFQCVLKSTISRKWGGGGWVIDYLLLNCGILCINGSELWPPIRAVEREATVLLEPGRPWKKNNTAQSKWAGSQQFCRFQWNICLLLRI